jgi:sortase A
MARRGRHIHRMTGEGRGSAPSSAVRTRILAAILLVVGIAAILYPYASDYLNRAQQAQVAQTQDEAVAHQAPQDLSAAWQAAEDFNQRLLEGRVVVTDPFDPNNQQPSDREYQQVLNVAGDGVMAELVIPKIDLDLPVYHGVDGEGMQHGVGHLPSTSLPIGGPSTHCVLAGHTGLPSARIFEDLDQLQPGDWFVIRVLGEDHAYRVTSTEVVLPTETDSLCVQDGKDLVTLVTCTPYGVNTNRLLVHAERCDVPPEWYDRDGDRTVPLLPSHDQGAPFKIAALLGAGAGLGIVVAQLVRRRKRARS